MSVMLRCLIIFLALTPGATAQRLRADTLVVHFAFDRSDIRPADSGILAQASQTADRGVPGHTRPAADSILILGYTDTAGSDAYNQQLSRRRAEAARTALLEFLAPAASTQPRMATPPIRLDARGESNPLPGDDSLSRRVEVIFYYQVKDTQAIAIAPHVDTPVARKDDEPDTTFGLDNINFIANTPILTDAARGALPHNVAYLKSFKNRYLEIDGFCNQPGPPLKPKDPLFILSVKRAKFIYDYLIEQGLDSSHLSYRGMGNTNPVNAHPTTAAEMDQNMRVEIRVFRKPQKQQ